MRPSKPVAAASRELNESSPLDQRAAQVHDWASFGSPILLSARGTIARTPRRNRPYYLQGSARRSPTTNLSEALPGERFAQHNQAPSAQSGASVTHCIRATSISTRNDRGPASTDWHSLP